MKDTKHLRMERYRAMMLAHRYAQPFVKKDMILATHQLFLTIVLVDNGKRGHH